MKKNFQNIILVIAFIFIYTPSWVNAQAFKEADNVLSVGYGFVVIEDGYSDVNGNGNANTSTGPFYLKYEHAMTDKMTIGINVTYEQYQSVYTDDYPNFPVYPQAYEETYNSLSILARINWHYGHLSKFDPYCGFGLGYRYVTVKYSANNPGGEYFGTNGETYPVGIELTIGARYYLTDMVAIYMETGIAESVVQVGLTYKLRKK